MPGEQRLSESWDFGERKLEPVVRIELTTYGLRNRCSTTELHWPTRWREIIPSNDNRQEKTPCRSTQFATECFGNLQKRLPRRFVR